MSRSFPKTFHYSPVDIKQSSTGKAVRGFKFPAGDAYKDGTNDAADEENLQQFQLYFGVNEVIASLEDIKRVGTDKTNKLYNMLLDELKKDYDAMSIACLRLA